MEIVKESLVIREFGMKVLWEKAGNKLVKSKIWVKREKGKWEKGILGKWERRQGRKCSGAWGSKGIKKIRKYGMMEWENLKKTFEYNIDMFAFVQLTQLLHKFCACSNIGLEFDNIEIGYINFYVKLMMNFF